MPSLRGNPSLSCSRIVPCNWFWNGNSKSSARRSTGCGTLIRSCLRPFPGAHRIIGMRNIIAHGYDSVDYEILWDAATRDLALLAKAVESLPDSGPVPRDRPRDPQQPDAPA